LDITEFVVVDARRAIPALLSLCPVFETKSPYDHYLIGRYTLPIYRKFDRFPITPQYLRYAAGQFLHWGDFQAMPEHFLRNLPLVIDSRPVVEVRPSTSPAWVHIECASFAIRFIVASNIACPLFGFPGMTIWIDGLAMRNDIGFPVAKISLQQWYEFAVDNKKHIIRLITNGTASTLALGVAGRLTIGHSMSLSNPHFVIAGNAIIARGASVSVPCHSFVDLFADSAVQSAVFSTCQLVVDQTELIIIVKILQAMIHFLPTLPEHFIRDFHLSLALSRKYWPFEYLALIFESILVLDPVHRNSFFWALFLDSHFLSLLNEPIRSQVLDFLVNRLTHIEVGAPKLRFCVICFFLSGCQQFLGFIRHIALTADWGKHSSSLRAFKARWHLRSGVITSIRIANLRNQTHNVFKKCVVLHLNRKVIYSVSLYLCVTSLNKNSLNFFNPSLKYRIIHF
jgi:hypothetical protein